MKSRSLLCYLLLLSFLLPVIFSVQTHAYTVNNFNVTSEYYFDISDLEYNQFDNEIRSQIEESQIYINQNIIPDDNYYKDNEIDISISYTYNAANSITYNLYFYNNSDQQFYNQSGTLTDNYISISDIKLTDDLKYIIIRYVVNSPDWQRDPLNTYNYYRFYISDISIFKDDSNLLNNIIDWLKTIINNIVSLPENISIALQGLFESLESNINEIAVDITDNIKGLFIPDDNYLNELYDKYDQLLEDKLGIMYQSIDLVVEHTQKLISAISTLQVDENDNYGYITFPDITVPLAGIEYTFGGWNVKVIPEGFDFLVESLKYITDIVCTIAVVNMLYHRILKMLKGY